MQVLEGSVIYRALNKLFRCYEHSLLKRFIAVFIMCCKNSFIARSLRAIARCKGYSQHSLTFRVIRLLSKYINAFFKKVYRWADKLVLRLSVLLQKWSEGSLLCCFLRFIGKASKEKLSVIALPIFGAGYIIGRLILNRLMIRDILLLSITFFAAAALLIDHEKVKVYFKNSLFYKICLLVLG